MDANFEARWGKGSALEELYHFFFDPFGKTPKPQVTYELTHVSLESCTLISFWERGLKAFWERGLNSRTFHFRVECSEIFVRPHHPPCFSLVIHYIHGEFNPTSILSHAVLWEADANDFEVVPLHPPKAHASDHGAKCAQRTTQTQSDQRAHRNAPKEKGRVRRIIHCG